MAKKKIVELDSVADFSKIADSIISVDLNSEVETSFLSYAYYVIGERAIPDARDGLKPVQRRILYMMHKSGNTPDKQHTKSAKIVGEVMGNLHPHGDSAIYDAMVRLAQPFTLMTPLIDGRGNFGDRPGAGAAASRYTEARMSNEALLLVNELRERPVDYVPNYDNKMDQPVVLPVQYPYLAINGASGIAVGFATNMAPHNPGEIIDATRWLLTHPNADLEKLMTFVPGPDFPTGCQVIGSDGIKEAYETGRGKITIRAPYRVEDLGRGKKALVFYEFPYEVNSETIIENIKKAIKEGKLQGIADVKDLTDRRNGIRLFIETKAGFNVDAIAASLYKNTALETGFAFNNIALVEDGTPQLLGLKRQLQIFIDHRIQVVTRRTETRKRKRDERLHLIEGLLKALANIDEVIKIIRAASDAEVARTNLMKKFKIDEIQANYILEIPLRRLTKFDQLELKDEKNKINGELKELNSILNDEKVLIALISKELEAARKVVDRPRRSVLVDGSLAEHLEATKAVAANVNVEIPDEECGIFLSAKNGIVRSNKTSSTRSYLSSVKTTTRGKFIAVTNKGRAFRIDAIHVGTKETTANNILPEKLATKEKVIALTPVELEKGQVGGLALGTKNGSVKIVTPTWPVRSDDFTVVSLDADDEILSARWVEDVNNYEFCFVTENANLLRFEAKSVRPQGLSGGGVAGIKLVDGAKAIAFGIISKEEVAKSLVITHTGKSVKATPYDLYGAKGRATQGMRSHKFLKGEDKLVLAAVSPSGTLFTAEGKEVPTPKIDKRRDGSGVAVKADELF